MGDVLYCLACRACDYYNKKDFLRDWGSCGLALCLSAWDIAKNTNDKK